MFNTDIREILGKLRKLMNENSEYAYNREKAKCLTNLLEILKNDLNYGNQLLSEVYNTGESNEINNTPIRKGQLKLIKGGKCDKVTENYKYESFDDTEGQNC